MHKIINAIPRVQVNVYNNSNKILGTPYLRYKGYVRIHIYPRGTLLLVILVSAKQCLTFDAIAVGRWSVFVDCMTVWPVEPSSKMAWQNFMEWLRFNDY